jgi:type VI secretion system protein ImpA
LDECLTELRGFDKRLDQRFGELAPGTSRIRQSLEDCRGLVRRILKDKGVLVEGEADAGQGASETGTGAAVAAGGNTGPIGSREDALRRLEEVAAYLRRAEPHSPVSYLIQRAVSWSQMSLDELLLELIEDQAARSRIDLTLGIRRPGS